MDCNQARELLEAYALDVLTAAERREVERHLATCAECSGLTQQQSEAAALLPRALGAASGLVPPPALKERVMQAAASPAPAATPSSLRGNGHGALPGGRRRSWRSLARPRTIAAIAALLLLVLSIAWSVRLSVALARERNLRAELASLVGQQELVLDVVDSPKTAKAFLRATGKGSPSYGKLYTRPDLPNVVAMAGKLAPPPSGEAYHLWLTAGGVTRLAGVLDVNAQGFGLLVLDAEHTGPAYQAALVTLQASGGDAPGGVRVLSWQAGP